MTYVSRSLLLAAGLSVVAACSSSTPSPATDAGTTTPTDASVADSAVVPQTDSGAGDAAKPDSATPSKCTNNGFTSVATDGIAKIDGTVLVAAQTTLATPVDTLELTLLPLTGSTVMPGKRTLTAKDASYADCSTCIVIRTKCDGNLSNCAKSFIATSGTLDLTTFSGKNQKLEALVDVTMVEVTIDDKLVTTPVPNGETWCLTGQKLTVDSVQ